MKPMMRNSGGKNMSPLNQFFDDFFNSSINEFVGHDHFNNTPSVNIYEEEEQYRIELAAPGFNISDFSVKTENDQLLISSEKKTELLEEGVKLKKREFSFGSFTRRFHLPSGISRSEIDAKYKDGILKVILPKTKEKMAMSRNIEIS